MLDTINYICNYILSKSKKPVKQTYEIGHSEKSFAKGGIEK